MNADRDMFLTQAMGGCWHERVDGKIGPLVYTKCSCGASGHVVWPNRDFSEWETFGVLWEWAQHQEWWENFIINRGGNVRTHLNTKLLPEVRTTFIHPDRFADALYSFLKDRP